MRRPLKTLSPSQKAEMTQRQQRNVDTIRYHHLGLGLGFRVDRYTSLTRMGKRLQGDYLVELVAR